METDSFAEKILPAGENYQSPEKITLSESRFGNKPEIIRAMGEGKIINVIGIEQLCPNIKPHANEVNVASIKHQNANQILGVQIQQGGNMLQCVFKPYDGENLRIKSDYGFQSFYPRECAAYMISEHFDLDIVPPTVIRNINGQIGSLQLFLDHNYWQDYSQAFEQRKDEIRGNDDWQKIAVFDWILANCERHGHNMMVRTTGDENELAAIDHGIILRSNHYFDVSLRGPSLSLTYNTKTQTGKQEALPKNLLHKLKFGLERKQDIDTQLRQLQGVTSQDVDQMWQRVKQTVKYRKFLSKMNFKEIIGTEWLSSELQHISYKK